jgi:hypothetical protein
LKGAMGRRFSLWAHRHCVTFQLAVLALALVGKSG